MHSIWRELFFRTSSDNRLQRVRSGARLFEVIKDQEDLNQKPIALIETVLPKQFPDPAQAQDRQSLPVLPAHEEQPSGKSSLFLSLSMLK